MLPLPMTAKQCADEVIAATFAQLLPGRLDSIEARVMLLAIALQESGLAHRKQVGGPAMGLWQFEQGGAVHGVLNHAASRLMARALCLLRAVAPNDGDLYRALSHDDLLACGIARLLLWTDAAPLPRLGDSMGAWDYYTRNWRPGKPHPARWGRSYSTALRTYRP